jgi:hypothetical protein
VRPLLVLSLLPATVVLAAFSPPLPERVQQEPPKSWIPDTKINQPPGTAVVEPPSPAAPVHAPPGFVCDVAPSGPQKATRAFVESYQAAKSAADGRRWDEAIVRAEAAAREAKTGPERSAVEGIRIVALAAMHADAELTATLEAALATGCLAPAQRDNYQTLLDEARQRLTAPKQ